MKKQVIALGFCGACSETVRQLKLSEQFEIVKWIGADDDCDENIASYPSKGEYLSVYSDIDDEKFDTIFRNGLELYSRYTAGHAKLMVGDHTLNDYENTFRMVARYFYHICKVNSIDLVLFSSIPHHGYDYLLYLAAQSLGIKTLLFYQHESLRSFCVTDIDDFGEFNTSVELEHITECELPVVEKPWYMNNEKWYESQFAICLRYIVFSKRNLVRPRQLYKKIVLALEYLHDAYVYRRNLKRITAKSVDLTEKFVYFPLHLQPELTTSALGGIYHDQLLAIERLSALLPDNIKIYIKENPKQTHHLRNENWFYRLRAIKNIVVVPQETNSFDLIRNSQFVATITGTAGWEALRMKKPVLVFGKAWYKYFNGAFIYSDNLLINDVLAYKIDLEKITEDYISVLNKCFDGLVDDDYKENAPDFDEVDNGKKVADAIEKISKVVFSRSEGRKYD